jgi:5-oxopent-3-ene-1,2,5-tricarboxylate decarboxylase/2-hydroxyhepta-2,4-diene-1,7-dioate isomerase
MELRRILLDGSVTSMELVDGELVAADGRRCSPDEAVHLAPCEPSKIICCHLNHISRVREFGTTLPPAPTYFHKPISSLNSHRGSVVRPSNCEWLNYEGEVAIIIGSTCRNIAYADAGRYIAGYSVANDFGLHDFRDTDSGSMLRVKGADTLCPIGPGLVTDWDPTGKSIRTVVNGSVVQDGSTDEMAWDMHYLVADIARLITLIPGDVILSGTPAGSRPVRPGDVVSVEVEGLGTLTNRIVEGPEPVSDEVGAQPTATDEVLSTALGGDWPDRGHRRPEATPRNELPFPRVRPRYER